MVKIHDYGQIQVRCALVPSWFERTSPKNTMIPECLNPIHDYSRPKRTQSRWVSEILLKSGLPAGFPFDCRCHAAHFPTLPGVVPRKVLMLNTLGEPRLVYLRFLFETTVPQKGTTFTWFNVLGVAIKPRLVPSIGNKPALALQILLDALMTLQTPSKRGGKSFRMVYSSHLCLVHSLSNCCSP